MDLLRFIRTHPDFAPLFDYVHALCWPILIWEILWLALWMRRTGIRDFTYSVDRWGFIDIHFIEDRPYPSAYRSPARTFRAFNDPSWASALPACLEAAPNDTLILPRARGRWPEGPEGVFTPFPNTS
ncbi:MAG: hypothetical protein RLO80_11480 [Hyphomonas sp.]